MRLFNPILYVGLGGTGSKLGTTLERRFRDELCGPDGRGLSQVDGLRPFELPAALQFIYADFDEEDTGSLRARVGHGSPTVQVMPNLAPASAVSYAQCAQSLRINLPHLTESWLPPGDVPVSPLTKGAGAYPTAGRAALWQTMDRHNGYANIMQTLSNAISRQSGNDARQQLASLSTQSKPDSFDVYVGFSVAGGTGCGIFYDFLHLIGLAYQSQRVLGQIVRIYPLVVLPSVIKRVQDQRLAALNGARGVLDLLSLVDFQNTGLETEKKYFAYEHPQGGGARATIDLETSMIPTAFMFSRPMGLEEQDLYESVASLVVSVSGTVGGPQDGDQQIQSFASGFINSGTQRSQASRTGIGLRSASAGLVASVAVPHEQIVTIVADAILGKGIADLAATPAVAEDNKALIARFITGAQLTDLRNQPALGTSASSVIAEVGGADLTAALMDRSDEMVESLKALRKEIERRMPSMARFDYAEGVAAMLSTGVDPFRARRAIAPAPDVLSVVGWLQRRAEAPPNEAGFGEHPPSVEAIRDRLFGLLRARQGDAEVALALEEQDDWLAWRVRVTWAEEWAKMQPAWQPTVAELQKAARLLPSALESYATGSNADFLSRSADLYRERSLVRYLLPPGDTHSGLTAFRERVTSRMLTEAQLGAGETEGTLINKIVAEGRGWEGLFRAAWPNDPDKAMTMLRQEVQSAVRKVVAQGDSDRLLPSLAYQLGEAARAVDGTSSKMYEMLSGLVTAQAIPDGNGVLKVLVSYPAVAADQTVEQYLAEVLPDFGALPQHVQFAPNHSELLAVVMHRTELGIDEIREVRDMIKIWGDASTAPLPLDNLNYRQRLGYETGSLQASSERRAFVLQRLLLSMWMGNVDVVEGDALNPKRIEIFPNRATGTRPISMVLEQFDEASSWATLVEAYERFAMHGDIVERDGCEALMSAGGEAYQWLYSRQRAKPSQLYRDLRSLAESQPAVLSGLRDRLPPALAPRVTRLSRFWSEVFPIALRLEIPGLGYKSLDDLERVNLD